MIPKPTDMTTRCVPYNDQPILWVAIGADATHLLTGDYAHFGKLYGSTIGGVLVLPPPEFLRVGS